MKRKLSLHSRIALSYVLLALVLASFFSAVAYNAVEVAEEHLIADRLKTMAGHLISRHLQGRSVDTPPGTTFYTGAHIPAQLQSLHDGIHEVYFGVNELHAIVITKEAQRFALVDDQQGFERAEQMIFAAIAAGFVGSLALALFLGLSIAGRVILPVTALATAINDNVSRTALPSLDAEDEMGILARAFAVRTDQLQQFLDRERLFTGDVSHELRTPLTVILGAAEVLAAQLQDRPDLLAAAERIRRAAADTAERTGALLMLSRAPETLDAPKTELRALVEREVVRCEPLLCGKAIERRLNAPEEVWVHARPELVGIALGNLLANAYQYTDEGYVNIELASGRLVIEDSGNGVPDSVRARLFERFVRGSSDRQSGTGLGLAIVKRVADHLNWEITLEPRPTGGSRFVLSFPSA
jgi:signal transduction histidine kinase